MLVHVLGSAAGGGFPQWNCNCPNCSRQRRGEFKGAARTQSSITVSADGKRWLLVNASPDIRAQIAAFPALWPARAARDSAIAAVLLVDAQIDHTAGLLFLREAGALEVYCTDNVYRELSGNFPVLKLLEHYCAVRRHVIPTAQAAEFSVAGATRLRFTALAVASKAPPYSPNRQRPQPGDTIALGIEDTLTGKRLFYAPVLGAAEPHLLRFLERADCVMVDGTFWRDDELALVGLGSRRARDMGHLPQSGPDGMIELLRPLAKARKILIHINNTNPILDEASPERVILERAGIEVAGDGLEVEL